MESTSSNASSKRTLHENSSEANCKQRRMFSSKEFRKKLHGESKLTGNLIMNCLELIL